MRFYNFGLCYTVNMITEMITDCYVKKKKNCGAGERDKQLSLLTALMEAQFPAPMEWFITVCNSISRGFNALF